MTESRFSDYFLGQAKVLLDKLHVDNFGILNAFSSASNPITPETIQDELESLGYTTSETREITGLLLYAAHYIESHYDVGSVSLFDDLSTHLPKLDEGEKREERIQALCNALKSEQLFMFEKITSLSYNHPRVARDTQLLVDVRPIFSRDRSSIELYVLLTSFNLTSSNESNETKTTQTFLDVEAIKELKKQCEQALDKIEKVSTSLRSAENRPIYMPRW